MLTLIALEMCAEVSRSVVKSVIKIYNSAQNGFDHYVPISYARVENKSHRGESSSFTSFNIEFKLNIDFRMLALLDVSHFSGMQRVQFYRSGSIASQRRDVFLHCFFFLISSRAELPYLRDATVCTEGMKREVSIDLRARVRVLPPDPTPSRHFHRG